MTNSNATSLGNLRGTPVYDSLAKQLRQYSLIISMSPNLCIGGSGTLVKYRNKTGILTATHIIIDNLDSQQIFAPYFATKDSTLFKNGPIPIKKFIYLENKQGLENLKKIPYPLNTLDICLIELETDVFENVLEESGKKHIDLSVYKDKYINNFEHYCCSNNNWCWAMDGAPRENVEHDDKNIVQSKNDGLFVSGGHYQSTPLVDVQPSYDVMADLCIHELGPTLDPLPNDFHGISGAGVWQVAFRGNNGMIHEIHELFFSGILVSGIAKKKIESRGPTSLYEIFLRYIDSFN